MKRNSIFRLAFAAIVALVLSASFVTRAAAAPENIDAKVLNHFAKTFVSAENVTWKHTKDYSRASFTRNNQHMEVFYNNRNELISTAAYINITDMPCAAVQTIDEDYNDYNCTNVIKYVDAENKVSYYAELENSKKVVILQSDTDGYTTVFKSARKK